MKNADQPAYPIEADKVSTNSKGLTKREYFAAMIASGKDGDPKQIAEHAIWVADELLKQLES